ncbi:MAG: hypothetical protein WCB68_23235 [Pyrinomonadaceae bacterium]
MKKIFSAFAALIFVAALSSGSAAFASAHDEKSADKNVRVEAPLNLAVLIQDDLVSRVGNELGVTGDFIRSLPQGSRVMVGYITSGSLQVRQPFTDDLGKAAKALRIPISSATASPYNPYVEVIEALRRFDKTGKNRNALLLISDGLDTSHGFNYADAANSLDLQRAISEAKKRDVAVYSFYAPSVGLTSRNSTATLLGQSALNRISDETGGRAFFQGTSFVSFEPYFEGLRRALNEQYAKAY